MHNLGLYIHIPFCAVKCPYCDFYSVKAEEGLMDRYLQALKTEIKQYGEQIKNPVDSIYFGGGTPTIFGAGRIGQVIKTVQDHFTTGAPEITVEANPSVDLEEEFKILKEAGVNRISIGLQSAGEKELKALGRNHTIQDVTNTVAFAKKSGIANISLDLMLGIPGQTVISLTGSIAFCAGLGVTHISAYILKIEDNTPYKKLEPTLHLPGEEEIEKLYLTACEELDRQGFLQYEISNFARKGYESHHNLKYWNCEEYLGVGPAAHSLIRGKRFFYERSVENFIKSPRTVSDGKGGSFFEYAMLKLRLTKGLTNSEVKSRFHMGIPDYIFKNAKMVPQEYLKISENGIRITRKGFLLSNSIIAKLLED